MLIRQSPKPSGVKIGAMYPAISARMLSCESVTMFSFASKVCMNQMIIEAKKMIVNARCKKSFAVSHKSCATFLRPGIL